MLLKGDVQLHFLNMYLYNIIEQLLKIHLGPHEESMTTVAHHIHLFSGQLPFNQRESKGYFLPF